MFSVYLPPTSHILDGGYGWGSFLCLPRASQNRIKTQFKCYLHSDLLHLWTSNKSNRSDAAGGELSIINFTAIALYLIKLALIIITLTTGIDWWLILGYVSQNKQ